MGFKFRSRCDSKTGCLYELDTYLGKKQSFNFNLGESDVTNLIAHYILITFFKSSFIKNIV